MSNIVVFVLLTVGGYGGGEVMYSPQMASLESCEQLRKQVISLTRGSAMCAAIQVPAK